MISLASLSPWVTAGHAAQVNVRERAGGMAFGAEGWDRVLGQEGQWWPPHPAASHGICLPGVEGFELGGMLDRAAVAAPASSVLEARHGVGLKFTGHFRASLWDVWLLTPC